MNYIEASGLTKPEFTALVAANLARTEAEDLAALRILMTWRCLLIHRWGGFRDGCDSCQFARIRFERAAREALRDMGIDL